MEQMRVRVFRYDPSRDQHPRYDVFDVPYSNNMTILDVLQFIQENVDRTIAFRWGCRIWQCGQCTLTVNGKPVLACKTNVNEKEITIEPLRHFSVVRDLVVDRTKEEGVIDRMKPFLIRKGSPIEEPEAIDLEVAGELIDKDKCIECNACVSSCPMISTRDMTHGFAGPLVMNKISKFVRDPRDSEDRISKACLEGVYSCTTCAHCKEVCPWDIDIPSSVVHLRQRVVETGVVTGTVKDALSNTYKYGNPYGQIVQNRGTWAEGLAVKRFSNGDRAEALLYVGCTASFDPRVQQVARSTVSLLREIGVDIGILGNEEKCCGDPVQQLGEKGLSDMLAEENFHLFEKYGVNRIVTICPHSYNTFLDNYTKKGIYVQHVTQLLCELVDKKRINFSRNVNATVTYHDPCFLGRYNKVYEPPRKILKSIPGLTFVEMPRNRENSFCCGTGGGMMWANEVFDERASAQRALEAARLEPDILATACPFCLIGLEDGLKIIEKADRVQVMDIVELVRAAI